jgi:thiosulfate dehydrogenase
MTRASTRLRRGGKSSFGSALVLVSTLGCTANTDDQRANAARGHELYQSKGLSSSALNLFSCASCHDEKTRDPELIKPGAVLAGVTERPSYWGGQEEDLLHAINDCRAEFMAASAPLGGGEPDADALYAYLASLSPGDTDAVPFSVVREIAGIPRGDATRGAPLYDKACKQCHGLMHTGFGRLDELVPILPDDTLLAHSPPAYSARTQRLVFIEKTRHGVFLNYGGQMPPFSLEVFPDTELSDVLEALGVLGQ